MILQPTLTGVPLSHVFQCSNIDARVHTLAIKSWRYSFQYSEGHFPIIQSRNVVLNSIQRWRYALQCRSHPLALLTSALFMPASPLEVCLEAASVGGQALLHWRDR